MASMDQNPDTSSDTAGAPTGSSDSASPFGSVFSEDQPAPPKTPARRTRKSAVRHVETPSGDAPARDAVAGDEATGADRADAGAVAPPETARQTTAKKASPRKAAAKKTTAAKTTAAKTTAAKTTAAKTTAAKTTAAKTTAAKTTARRSTRKSAGSETEAALDLTGPVVDEATVAGADADAPDPASSVSPEPGHVEDVGDDAQDAATQYPADALAPEDVEADDQDQEPAAAAPPSPFGLLFQAPDLSAVAARQPRSRRAEPAQADAPDDRGSHAGTAESDARSDSGPASAGSGVADSDSAGSAAADSDSTGTDSGDGATRSSRGRGSRRTSRPSQGEGRGPGSQSQDESGTGSADQGGDAVQQGESPGEDDGDDSESALARRRRRRGGKGRRGRGVSTEDGGDLGDTDSQSDQGDTTSEADDTSGEAHSDGESSPGNVRRRRRSNRRGEDTEAGESRRAREEVTGVRGSTRLEAKRQRRREGREAGRRRSIITEAEFLARRESVERTMVVRGLEDRTQIGVLEDGVLVEHYVSRETQSTMVGNVYLGRVQNVLPSMEAAFVDIGKGRNAVLYAGEVNWDAAGLDNNQPKRIENALKSGDSVLVQVTKDPIGHKGARLTSQVSLPGRYLVLVPGNSMTGISRKLPDTERARLKKILKEVVPEGAGVIVRTAAEGASEEELRADVERLTDMWQRIESKQKSANAPALVHGEPDMTVRVIRDVFNEDFAKVVVSGERAWTEVSDYIAGVAPDLAERLEKWTGTQDVFTHYRVTEALAKAMDRKVWLPSGGSLVIDRTEAMTVVDVNTGKFVGSGGNLEETVTKNNIEAAEEIVRQLRLRDIGGIIVIDFIDMVLESNRDLVVRRLLECLGRDRTKHQVAEVTSLGLVQMTRKRVGAGLIEVFSEACVHCSGRGIIVHSEPIEKADGGGHTSGGSSSGGGRRGRGRSGAQGGDSAVQSRPTPAPGGPTPAQIAAAAHAAAIAGSTQTSAKAADGPTGRTDATTASDAAGDKGAETAVPETGAGTAAPRTDSVTAVPETGAGTAAPRTDSARRSGGATAWRPPATESAAEPEAPAASEPSTPSEPTPPRARGARRASRRAQSAPTAPPATESTPASTPQTRVAGTTTEDPAPAAVSAGTGTAQSEPVPPGAGAAPSQAAQGTNAATPGRRRARGRVVAPAGPPTAVAGDSTESSSADSTATPVGEAPAGAAVPSEEPGPDSP